MDLFPYRIRPIESEKDAADIAKLIRSSFRPWLDLDNIDYLFQLQKEGEKALKHPFLTKLTGFPYNLTGIVCTDENNTIIGVINTSNFYQNERKCCLISNVCTAQDHRKEGIATHMIREIERIQRNQGVYGLYLQARMEAIDTITLYRQNGFSVTDYRKTWIYPKQKLFFSSVSQEYHIENVPSSDKIFIENMFQARYPSSILWNLDYKEDLLETGFHTKLKRLLSGNTNRFQRIADRSGNVKTWFTIQHLQENLAQLWLIPNKKVSDSEIEQSIRTIMKNLNGKFAIKLDTPAADPDTIYKTTGFTLQHTLAWMWKKL